MRATVATPPSFTVAVIPAPPVTLPPVPPGATSVINPLATLPVHPSGNCSRKPEPILTPAPFRYVVGGMLSAEVHGARAKQSAATMPTESKILCRRVTGHPIP